MATDPITPASPAEFGPSVVENQKSKIQRLLAYRLLLGIALAVFVFDQLTKAWIVSHLPYNPHHLHGGPYDRALVSGFFYLIHVGNTGAAWSMFSDKSVLLAVLAGG